MIIWRGIYESGTARIDTSAWQLARNIIISGEAGIRHFGWTETCLAVSRTCVFGRGRIFRERDVEKVTNVIGICDY